MRVVNRFLVLSLIGVLLFVVAFVSAQEEEVSSTENSIQTEVQTSQENSEKVFDELKEEYKDEVVKDGGTAPGDAFYAFDKFFDGFGNPLEVREERVGEIRDLIEEGNIDGAREALEDYNQRTEELERDADPERRQEARRSATAIYNSLSDIEDKIPEENRAEFFEGIIETESRIVTSVEISSKIKELCIQLAELDPSQYQETCKSENDSPKWKKELDRKLTDEQKEEAKKFGQVMSQCMKTSGRECKCEEISFYDFSITCSQIAPLAVKCDEGDEESCKMMDEIEMPELPDYLQDVFDNIEMQYGEAKYGLHMPFECVEAGVKNPKECAKIMIKEHAPPECKQALLDADIENEREGREICDKIMFEKYAPQECIDKGITNPKDCGKFMEQYGPKERRGPGPGQDCMKIQEPMERLKCFENSMGQMENEYGVGKEFGGEITWQCKENRIHDLQDCKIFMDNEWPKMEQQRKVEFQDRIQQKDDWREMEKQCANSCGKDWDFYNGRCVCKDVTQEQYRQEDRKDYREQEQFREGEQYPRPPEGEYQQPPQGEYQPPQEPRTDMPSSEPASETESSPATSSDGSGESSTESSSSSESSESSLRGGESSSSESSSSGESSPATAAVISGNAFLNYWGSR